MFLAVLLFSQCRNLEKSSPEDYAKEWQNWKEMRAERLKSKNGWLNLAGLYWLQEGENTFGSDSSNQIIFPKESPRFAGIFVLQQGVVILNVSDKVQIKHEDQPVSSLVLDDDSKGKPTVLTMDSLSWFIIKRGERFGIRLRDYNHPLVRNFKGIDYFPWNMNNRITAKYTPFSTSKKFYIPTVIGTEEEMTAPGILTFQYNNRELQLYPFESGDTFFLIFADLTNGNTTYPAGRFLYSELPDKNNEVILDFNKSYNPPCAFTPFATCPLPPKENFLSVKIEAGEKDPHIPGHE